VSAGKDAWVNVQRVYMIAEVVLRWKVIGRSLLEYSRGHSQIQKISIDTNDGDTKVMKI
jgi:hypothetical protein